MSGVGNFFSILFCLLINCCAARKPSAICLIPLVSSYLKKLLFVVVGKMVGGKLCGVCGKMFHRKSNFIQHKKMMHGICEQKEKIEKKKRRPAKNACYSEETPPWGKNDFEQCHNTIEDKFAKQISKSRIAWRTSLNIFPQIFFKIVI